MRWLIRRKKNPSSAIAPFGDEAAKLPFLDRDLADFQRTEAEAAGFSVIDLPADAPLPPDAHGFFAEDLLFTREVLARLDERRAKDRATRAALAPKTALFDFACPFLSIPDDRPHLLPLVMGPAKSSADDAATILFGDDEPVDALNVAPYGAPPHRLRVPSGAVVGQITHWLHVLNFNQALLARERRRCGALGARNAIRGKIKRSASALLEGSIVEDGVQLEAGCSVIDSYLGRGVSVAAHAVLHRCVVGADCHTLIDTHLRRVVAMRSSTLSNLGITDVLLGRELFITTGVGHFGAVPGQGAVVDGEPIRRPVLGFAAGHKSILGARSLFSTGVAVPSGTIIVMKPDEGAAKITGPGLARAHMRLVDGASD